MISASKIKQAHAVIGCTNLELAIMIGCGERTVERLRANGGDTPEAILICVLAGKVNLDDLKEKVGHEPVPTFGNWRPIDTAPKDGSRIILKSVLDVGFYHWGGVRPARWLDDGWHTGPDTPTGWMPGPEP
jgi:hypothetical protein